MSEQTMPQFRRKPAMKITVAELKATTCALSKNGEDQYEAQNFLTPTGEITSKVLIVGTAIEKEDVGTDQSFWRLRVADPTGGIAVFAGQYQAEAAQTIASLNIPCFVAVVGKPSIYEPEGGNRVVSVRPESISVIGLDDRNSFLLDVAEQLAARMNAPKNAERVKQVYPDWDSKLLARALADALKDMVEPKVEPPAQPSQTPAEALKDAKGKKDIKATAKPEEPKEDKKKSTMDPTELVYNIIAKEVKGCSYQKLTDELKKQGFAMIDLDGAISKLMKEGRVYEPKIGILQAV